MMDAILRGLGFAPTFWYEKYRAEWADGKGKVVVDETPIGNFCEIEGPSRWIDATAKELGVKPADYITKNYATLFLDWKQESGSAAGEMTFRAVKAGRKRSYLTSVGRNASSLRLAGRARRPSPHDL